MPDEAQFSRLKSGFGLKLSRDEYLEMVKTEEASSVERMRTVTVDHPGTPWARRAQTELDMGFGFVVGDRVWDPSANAAKPQNECRICSVHLSRMRDEPPWSDTWHGHCSRMLRTFRASPCRPIDFRHLAPDQAADETDTSMLFQQFLKQI